MVKPIVHDPIRLAVPSAPAEKTDLPAAQDLLDTFEANRTGCVGMAANMIGVPRRIIVLEVCGKPLLMLNPQMTAKKNRYEATEGCLSLPGQRRAVRWQEITVRYQDTSFVWHTGTFSGFPAQIIQHEMDHCNGIII